MLAMHAGFDLRADEKHRGRCAVVGPLRAVLGHTTAELREDDRDDPLAMSVMLQVFMKRRQRQSESSQQSAVTDRLARVRVEAIERGVMTRSPAPASMSCATSFSRSARRDSG